jgi:hypothetical protein
MLRAIFVIEGSRSGNVLLSPITLKKRRNTEYPRTDCSASGGVTRALLVALLFANNAP